MKNKLALTTPIVKNLPALVPPPRKEDLITAMTERALVKHEEESKKLEAAKQVALDLFSAAVLKELKAHPDNFETRVLTYTQPEVEYRMIVVPPHITKLKDAIRNAPSLRAFDFAATKKRIREGMNTSGNRVQALLDDPLAVAALDKALSKL